MKIFAEVVQVCLLSVVSLVTLFLVSRPGGKRQISQMSMFDYINSITVGSIAAEMATNLEEWYKPFTGILAYGLMAWLVHLAAYKSLRGRLLLSGRAIVLMENGVILRQNLRRAAIDLNEFLAQCRIAGFFDLRDLATATLETNGQLSFLPQSGARPATTKDLALQTQPASTWIDLILDGHIMEHNLQSAGKDRAWLDAQLHRQGIGRASETFYAACSRNNDFFACRANR